MPSAPTKFVQRTLKRAVLLPVIGATIVGIVFLTIIGRLLSETNRLNHSQEVIVCAEQIRQLAVDMETGQRGYLLSNDRRFLEPYNRALTAMPRLVDRLDRLASDNPQQHLMLRSSLRISMSGAATPRRSRPVGPLRASLSQARH